VAGLTIKKPGDLYINTDMFASDAIDTSAASTATLEVTEKNVLKKTIGTDKCGLKMRAFEISGLHLRHASPRGLRERPKNPKGSTARA